jgi:YD repeat-containing protein
MNISMMLRASAVAAGVCVALAAHADGVEEPIPSFYQEPGLSPSRAYVNQHANESIDPFTGKVQWHFTDLFIPGNGGMDLAIQRSYSSLDDQFPEASPAGYGWTMHFGRVLRKANAGLCTTGRTAIWNPVLETQDGGRQILYEALDGFTFITTRFWRAECNAQGYMTVVSPDGTRYDMNTPGLPLGSATHPVNTYYVSRITDRNGNWIALDYTLMSNTVGISQITTSDGRTVNFTYAGGMLKTVTDGQRTWTYTVASGFLTEVKRPDGQSWKFDYYPLNPGNVGQASLKQVTYPTGGLVNYTYGEVRFNQNYNLPRAHALIQKTADGATWTYAYQPATETLPADQALWTEFPDAKVDITTITGPEGTRVHRHIGYTSVPSGGVMHIGQPVSVWLANTQAEGYSHNIQLISNQANVRPGDTLTFDPATYASIDWGRNLNRNGQRYNRNYPSLDQYGNPLTILEEGTDTRTTDVTYAINTSRWMLRQKKDETIKVTTAEGEQAVGTVTRDLDPNGNVLSENRFGVTTTYTYWPTGDVQTKKDARNNTVTFSSYHRGIPRNEDHPENVTITRTVSDAGNVLSETDGEQSTTSWQFDELNRPTKITHAAGNPVNVVWAPTTRTTTRGAYREVVSYDTYGRESQVVHTDTSTSQSVTVTYRNDKLGRRVFTSHPNDSTRGTHQQLDIVGQVSIVGLSATPDGSSAAAWRGFSRLANVIRFENERNKIFERTYRNFGDPNERHLMAVAAPEPAASITMKRNGLGQLTEVTQDGKMRSFVYDTRYFLTSQTDPETGETVYGRDAVGNMTSRKVGAAGAIGFSYDGRNRLRTVTYPDGSTVVRTYYKDDKLQSLANAAATRSYVYDGNKSLTSETLVVGTQTFTTGYAYNANDALESVTYGTGPTIAYAPDGFGRPTQATPYVTGISHHPSGAVSSMTYANGVQTTIGLNNRLWPNTLKISKASAAVFDKTYYYDTIGNVLGIDDTAINSYPRMTYDNIDRLATATGPWTGTYKASYDGRGNITRQAWTDGGTVEYVSRAYTYGSASDLLNSVLETRGGATTTFAYGYDAQGNVTAKGAQTFGYTDASTMRCAACGTAAETLYDYDGANMRVSMRKNGATTYFMYGSAGNLLWEQTPGVSLKQYFYVGGKQVATHEKPLAP